MPLADYIILDSDGNPTDEVIEELFKQKEPIPDFLYSSDGRVAKRKVHLIGITKGKWGDCSYASGWDHGLGMYINNNQEREAVMKARGLISHTDFNNKHMSQDMYEAKKTNDAHWDKREVEYQELCKTNTEEQASVIWSSREKCEADKPFLPDNLK